MKCIAVYSSKGGVGKTTLAANLAWASATLSARSTLIWDLDSQAGASFLFDHKKGGARAAEAVFKRTIPAEKLIEDTPIDRVLLLPADRSLRKLNHYFHELGKKGRLANLVEEVGKDFDRIILDCPPGLTETSAQVLRAADLIVLPIIPSPLSLRALDEVYESLDSKSIPRSRTLPVFNMVDRRRTLHLATLAAHPGWPALPMSSAFEAMSAGERSIGALPPGSPAGKGLAALWRKVEQRLAKG